MQTLTTTTISFPEISLSTRDGHKLRGYFGNVFKEHSPLLHNHWEDGSSRYAYPLIQYKVINKVPMLIGINEGGELLVQLFLKIREIDINGIKYPVLEKNIVSKRYPIGVDEDLHTYQFSTLWMALNQENHKEYVKQNEEEKLKILKSIFIRNVLNFYKAVGYRAEEKILCQAKLQQKETQFKNNVMLAFEGSITTNALLPDLVGIGKAVSRGFGTLQKSR